VPHIAHEPSRWHLQTAWRACLTTFIPGLVLGCSELPEPQWEGEYVVLAAEEPERVCAGTVEYMDRRAGELFEKLGSDPVQVEFYLLNDIGDYCGHDDGVFACAHGSRVYSKRVPAMHEFVHTRSGGVLPPALEEGLATYLGDPYPINGVAPRERMAELLTQGIDLETGGDYGRAAHFMTFLDEQFGWDTLLVLDAMLGRESTVSQIDAAFLAAFDLDIQAVLALYEDYPECTGTVDVSLACAGSAAPPGFPSAVWEHQVDCGATDAIGPENNMVFVEQVIELGPVFDGTRSVGVTGDGAEHGGFVLLRRCGPCLENGVGTIRGPGPFFVPEAVLPPGRYVARFYLPLTVAPATVGLRIDG
jgi:hypothetical protein